MDANKVAKELVAIAKSLTANDYVPDSDSHEDMRRARKLGEIVKSAKDWDDIGNKLKERGLRFTKNNYSYFPHDSYVVDAGGEYEYLLTYKTYAKESDLVVDDIAIGRIYGRG